MRKIFAIPLQYKNIEIAEERPCFPLIYIYGEIAHKKTLGEKIPMNKFTSSKTIKLGHILAAIVIA